MITFTVHTCSSKVCGESFVATKVQDLMTRTQTELVNAIWANELDPAKGISIEIYPSKMIDRGSAWDHETRIEIR